MTLITIFLLFFVIPAVVVGVVCTVYANRPATLVLTTIERKGHDYVLTFTRNGQTVQARGSGSLFRWTHDGTLVGPHSTLQWIWQQVALYNWRNES